jgi:hypothetical protein
MMNPLDVKKKVLGAVKGYGREGIGEMLKKGYGPPEGKPAVAIEIKSTKIEPEMEEGEMEEGEHEMPDGSMMKDSEMGEMPEKPMAEGMEMKGEGEGKITPELLEMLLAKLGK